MLTNNISSTFNQCLNRELSVVRAILMDELNVLAASECIPFHLEDRMYTFAVNLCIECEYIIPESQLKELVTETVDDFNWSFFDDYYEGAPESSASWLDTQISEITEQFSLALAQH